MKCYITCGKKGHRFDYTVEMTPPKVGEEVFFEGSPNTYEVVDIQHQLRMTSNGPVFVLVNILVKPSGCVS